MISPEQNDFWTNQLTVFPDRNRSTRHGIASGSDGLNILCLSNPIAFKVRVPKKNQHAYGGTPDIPSDTYWVAWNGVAVFVLWEQGQYEIPISGGHVVADILRDALKNSGSDLYVQSCSPGCEYMFLHQTMRIIEDATIDDYEVRPGSGTQEVLVVFEALDGPDLQVVWVALTVGSALGNFAEFKNYGRRLIDLENECRQDLGHLLTHFAEHARIVNSGWRPRALSRRWYARGWRKEARSLVADVWLALANIEAIKRSWDQERMNVADSEEFQPLFASDFSRDVITIDALRVEPISENVNQIAGWLNNHSVVMATGLGALAGGAAGSIATLLG